MILVDPECVTEQRFTENIWRADVHRPHLEPVLGGLTAVQVNHERAPRIVRVGRDGDSALCERTFHINRPRASIQDHT